MFYQNSNDLVKHASAKTGHVQNSSETRELLMKQTTVGVADNASLVGEPSNMDRGNRDEPSLSIGAKFQNAIQSMIQSVSLKEGLEAGGGGGAAPATTSTGPLGSSNVNKGEFIDNQKKQDDQYTQQELDHIQNVNDIVKLVAKEDKNTRQNWVEVTDGAGVAKYGYITKDGIFQIWHAPPSSETNWFNTDKMKKNVGVIGCPAASGTIKKIKIAGTWDSIKPYDMVYADGDNGRKNPLFLLVNDGVRNPNNSVGGKGLFSCGNESGNVFVKERPSADFNFNTTRMGCYVVNDNVKDSDFKNRGFTFQEDMTEVSISQCKRRAEDLGSSYFLVSPPEKGKPENKGGCWIYTGSGEPNINGLLSFDKDAKNCHAMPNPEGGEDGFMKAYTTTNLKRLYGKETTLKVPANPPNPECDHKTRNGCIFKSYNHVGGAVCYPPNWNGAWAYGGLYNYNNDQLKGWLGALHNRNGDNVERAAVNDYIEKCKNTEGYEFLDDNQTPRTKQQRSVALYSLKTGGPTGVDDTDRNGKGFVGRIAYIDHNGERHDYPASALSYTKSEKGASYVNLGGYDTRSAESSYSLKEITPGSYSEASNLLYKASRDGWSQQKFHQLCDNKGPTYTRAIINDGSGRVLGAYTANSWSSSVQNYKPDPTAFLYDGTSKFTPNNGAWGAGSYETYMNSSYYPTFGGGHDFYITGQTLYNNAYTFLTNSKKAPFGRNQYTYQGYSLGDLEVYSVDATTFPNTLEYARRLRTMPVGESISASLEKCRGMCDADEKCGGFVYTKGSGGADGKCELKDRAKMYPAGLRISDPTKQLMLKVPTINGNIGDEQCRVRNGEYSLVDSAQYSHYPDTGAMSSGTKCDISTMIPKKGSLQPGDTNAMGSATSGVIIQTQQKTKEYRDQTTVSSETVENFTVGQEGMTGETYANTMVGVQKDLTKIANAEYQRERLIAMNEESNKLLISESYKFILWSILAILAVLAVLKLKETFGQDDVDENAGSGGGFFASILAFFGFGSVKLDDIADRTGDVKEALSNAGQQLMETGEKLSTTITQGADNLVSSMNDAATGAVEGVKNIANTVSETATNAVNSIGETTGLASGSSTSTSTSSGVSGATTGGRVRKPQYSRK